MPDLKVSDLFKNNFFPDFKLLAGQGGVSNEIRTVFIIDSPDFCNWLRGGELVIGNGYVFRDSPEKFPVFLKSLVEHNVAALGMKFDRFRFAYDYEEIIKLANRYSFPLIEVPFKYTWNMIFNEIYRENRSAMPSGVLGTIPDVLSVIEERTDPVDLIYSLNSKINREIYVYSNKLQLCHHIDEQGRDSNRGEGERFRKNTVLTRNHLHSIGSIAISTLTKSVDGKTLKFANYQICNIEVYVKLQDKEEILPARNEKIVINTLLLFYLMVMNEVLIDDSERKKLHSLLERLLSGRYSDFSNLSSQFKNLRLQLPIPCVILLLHKTNTIALEREIQSITPLNCLIGEQFVLILNPNKFEEKQENIRKIIKENEIFGIHSGIIKNIENISHVFLEILEGMTWIKRFEMPSNLYSYYDILLKIGISKFSELKESITIVKRYWDPIKTIQHRNAVSMELFSAKLIESNFNLSKTSTNINVHYNTARNYLEELENKLNINLNDTESRFLFMLAQYINNITQYSDSTHKNE